MMSLPARVALTLILCVAGGALSAFLPWGAFWPFALFTPAVFAALATVVLAGAWRRDRPWRPSSDPGSDDVEKS
jgi:hypothetical protein